MSLQVANNVSYSDILRSIKEGRTGLVQGLFAGLPVSLVGTILYQISSYSAEALCDNCIEWLREKEVLAKSESRGNSVALLAKVCLTGVIGHVSAYPFDTVCARMQSGEFASLYGCVAMILEEEGIPGFFKGVFVDLVRALPMTLLMSATLWPTTGSKHIPKGKGKQPTIGI